MSFDIFKLSNSNLSNVQSVTRFSNFRTCTLSLVYIFPNPLETYVFEHLLETPFGTNDNPRAGSNFKLSNLWALNFSNFQNLNFQISNVQNVQKKLTKYEGCPFWFLEEFCEYPTGFCSGSPRLGLGSVRVRIGSASVLFGVASARPSLEANRCLHSIHHETNIAS